MKLQANWRRLIGPVTRITASGLILLCAGSLVPRRASAIFGIGDIVFDPSSWAQLVSSDLTLGAQLAQAIKIAENGLQTYHQATAMAVAFSHIRKSDWVPLAQMAVADHVSNLDLMGESAGWSSAVSGNPTQAPGAWQAATVGLGDLHSLMAGQTVGSSQLLGQLATINAADGSSIKCMQTISQYRGNSVANALGPIIKLAIAHLDGTAATNSNVQQLNLLNAHQQQIGTEMRAQGDMNACLVEQMIVQSMQQRNQQAAALNFSSGYANDSAVYSSHPITPSSAYSFTLP